MGPLARAQSFHEVLEEKLAWQSNENRKNNTEQSHLKNFVRSSDLINQWSPVQQNQRAPLLKLDQFPEHARSGLQKIEFLLQKTFVNIPRDKNSFLSFLRRILMDLHPDRSSHKNSHELFVVALPIIHKLREFALSDEFKRLCQSFTNPYQRP